MVQPSKDRKVTRVTVVHLVQRAKVGVMVALVQQDPQGLGAQMVPQVGMGQLDLRAKQAWQAEMGILAEMEVQEEMVSVFNV